MFDLKNKVALVTGGRRGMGRSHALALARQGAHVVVTDIDANECASVVEEITSIGGVGACYKMDVSDKTEVGRVFDEMIKRFGRVDILVNNAGIYVAKPALEISETDWNKMIGINLSGQFFAHSGPRKKWQKPEAAGSSTSPRWHRGRSVSVLRAVHIIRLQKVVL